MPDPTTFGPSAVTEAEVNAYLAEVMPGAARVDLLRAGFARCRWTDAAATPDLTNPTSERTRYPDRPR